MILWGVAKLTASAAVCPGSQLDKKQYCKTAWQAATSAASEQACS
jgi:hypothetical protein